MKKRFRIANFLINQTHVENIFLNFYKSPSETKVFQMQIHEFVFVPIFWRKPKFLCLKTIFSNFRTGCFSSRLDGLASLDDMYATLTSLGRDITGGELLQAVRVAHLDYLRRIRIQRNGLVL